MEALNKAAPVITRSMQACTDCIEAIKQLGERKKDGEVLLPISESAYAYGKVEETENVLVGIGGGYMAELPAATAIKMYEGRISNRKSEMLRIRGALGQH